MAGSALSLGEIFRPVSALRRRGSTIFLGAPIAQLAEAADLKSAQCRFEPDWGHNYQVKRLSEWLIFG